MPSKAAKRPKGPIGPGADRNAVPAYKKRFIGKIIIYPKFQAMLIGVNIALLIVTAVFVMVQLHSVSDSLRKLGEQAGFGTDHVYNRFIVWQFGRIYGDIAFAFLAGAFVSGVVAALLSHRLAGPIVRLRGYFRQIEKTGKVEGEIRFRDGDFFDDLPAIINGALAKVAPQSEAENREP